VDKGGRSAALIHIDSAFVYRILDTQKSRVAFDTVRGKAKLKEMMVARISRQPSDDPSVSRPLPAELLKRANSRKRAVR
jgi:hypothetical protein